MRHYNHPTMMTMIMKNWKKNKKNKFIGIVHFFLSFSIKIIDTMDILSSGVLQEFLFTERKSSLRQSNDPKTVERNFTSWGSGNIETTLVYRYRRICLSNDGIHTKEEEKVNLNSNISSKKLSICLFFWRSTKRIIDEHSSPNEKYYFDPSRFLFKRIWFSSQWWGMNMNQSISPPLLKILRHIYKEWKLKLKFFRCISVWMVCFDRTTTIFDTASNALLSCPEKMVRPLLHSISINWRFFLGKNSSSEFLIEILSRQWSSRDLYGRWNLPSMTLIFLISATKKLCILEEISEITFLSREMNQ